MQHRTIARHLDSDLDAPGHRPSPTAEAAVPLDRQLVDIAGQRIPRIVGELWTSGQRQAASIHEVSYRACFKPQLPAYFIKRFTREGDAVYDPFSGRGTTAIEAALWGRNVVANDANPLSALLAQPRLAPPTPDTIKARLAAIPLDETLRADIDLSMFYHPRTEAELVSLQRYLVARRDTGAEDTIDAWIRMVATNRLTGHSTGFFSVYTFPPNQAVSQASQVRINARRSQAPDYRDTKAIVFRKSRQLLRGLDARQLANLHAASRSAMFLTGDARRTPGIPDDFVQLTVTSPPFLDIVQYADDNWLRCWFNGLPLDAIAPTITTARTVERWAEVMGAVFVELFRVTRPGGLVAFEVGEVRKGKVRLEESVVPLGLAAGFRCEAILINAQQFTKTANIWGVTNNRSGTNTNRIVLLQKP
jgi:hypothetical protein